MNSCGSATAVFDMDEFVLRNLGDIELARDVAAIFRNNSPEYIESIRTALAARDADALRRSAHKLKGASATLTLSQLSEIACLIESCAEAGNLEKAEQMLAMLELRLEQAVDELRVMLITPQGKARQ